MQDTDKTHQAAEKKPSMEIVDMENDTFFRISHYDAMRPFFMSIVSDANHWLFISSNGGLTAGRKNPEYALFPYYTEDKITESADTTGSKTIVQIHGEKGVLTWEPFSDRCAGQYAFSRNLYKGIHGNTILFEEVNHDLGLTFRYQWQSGKLFGFIRRATLINHSGNDYRITLLDGIQNIMPYGVPSTLQASTSNLVDAYKRSELEPESGIGIYALSAVIVDKAEPSEALKANIAWSVGMDRPKHLLSSLQLKRFRQGEPVEAEKDVKGEKGAYFLVSDILLSAKAEKKWAIMANVNQGHAQIVSLAKAIRDDRQLEQKIGEDIDSGTKGLIELVASADGFQFTADKLYDTRHYSNVLFNIMRGGIFDNNYQLEKGDFVSYLEKAHKGLVARNRGVIDNLGPLFSQSELRQELAKSSDADLFRLAMEYLPLKFSRRHGDPSRPWNYFNINTQNETDGSKILDYEGNWRDLFQNWEALACSYPGFLEGMIFKFLNASTFDGYNPYRVNKDGFDWESIEADNPWSYIGYWGDHQIIYLLKFLESLDRHQPGKLQQHFGTECFVYAAVPYRIKSHEEILENPKDTIAFDYQWDKEIRERRGSVGADGALLTGSQGEIIRVNFLEKILAIVLAKMSNFIPGAGIWLNTQRPEWNDANNALVGNGVSVLTMYYLYRFMKFFDRLLADTTMESVKLSSELIEFYHSVRETLHGHRSLLAEPIGDKERKEVVDRLGVAASDYRQQIYKNGFWGKKRSASLAGMRRFSALCLQWMEHSIRANKRHDALYHSYKLITIWESALVLSDLDQMLEGQVAVLSSGHLAPSEALDLLDALRSGPLYREDQNSYILYPNKELAGFLEKNTIPSGDVASSALLSRLIADGNREIVERDILGKVHFNGNFRNAGDLDKALSGLSAEAYGELVSMDRRRLLDIFEKVFNHKAFTGRSGTFFAYEGLGSIYWHMVSKLHLAVQECCLKAIEEGADPEVTGRLLEHYHAIDAGIGVHKSPVEYGAFPTDPYSHTPMHRGAQQPGMTGQVKEDILVRFGELGVSVREGQLYFNPTLLRKQAFLQEGRTVEYLDVHKKKRSIQLSPASLFFTCCQVPVLYVMADAEGMKTVFSDGTESNHDTLCLDPETSCQVFQRTGIIDRIVVYLRESRLK